MELMEEIASRGTHAKYAVLVLTAQFYYEEPHRAYHSWNHIVEGAHMALDLSRTSDTGEFDLNLSQQLAWLFHDIVYIPGAANGQNEYASANMLDLLFRPHGSLLPERLREEFHSGILREAKDIIRSTIHHSPGNPLHKPVCDIDLAGFHDEETFLRNNGLLEEEFAISTTHFERGQVAFLSSLLERDFIYSTRHAREYWEKPARDNINRFIKSMLEKYPDLQETNRPRAVSPA